MRDKSTLYAAYRGNTQLILELLKDKKVIVYDTDDWGWNLLYVGDYYSIECLILLLLVWAMMVLYSLTLSSTRPWAIRIKDVSGYCIRE